MITRRKFFTSLSLALAALSVSPRLLAADRPAKPKRKLRLQKDDVILFYGDSITDGNRDRTNRAPSKPNGMGGGYALAASSALACRYPNMGFKFWNRGINGNKTFQMIARLQEDCFGLKYKPTVVSILTGINDYALSYVKQGKGDPAKYEADLRELLTRITEGLPGVRLIVMEPFAIEGLREKIDGFLPEFYEYQPIAKRVAQEFGAVFVPLQEHFDKAGKRYGKKRFSTDGVHPWSAGVELVARAWLDAVEVIE